MRRTAWPSSAANAVSSSTRSRTERGKSSHPSACAMISTCLGSTDHGAGSCFQSLTRKSSCASLARASSRLRAGVSERDATRDSTAGELLLLVLDRGEHRVVGIGERLHALDLQFLRDVVQRDLRLRQRFDRAVRFVQIRLDRVGDDRSMVAQRIERRRRHGVHGVFPDDVFDVQQVGVRGILRAGARPQRPLHAARPLL